MRNSLLAAVAVLAVPQDPVALGNEAALLGGAVCAVRTDSGAQWYNPAGLATARRSLSVSASAFAARWMRAPDALGVELPGRTDSQDVESFRFASLPSAVAMTKPLADGWVLGLGLFVPKQEELLLETQLELQPQSEAYSGRFLLRDAVARYHLGPAVGWAIAPTFRVGASVFAVYEERDLLLEAGGGVDGGLDNRSHLFVREIRASEALGVQAVVGAQWDVAPALTVGLAVRSPVWIVVDRESLSHEARLTVLTPGPDDVFEARTEVVESEDEALEMVTPARIYLGTSARLSPDVLLSVEGDYTLPLENPDRRIDTEAVVNGRVGLMWAASSALRVGVGLFTDFGGDPAPRRVGDVALDDFGATGGLEWLTLYPLSAGGEVRVGTTVGLRYAHGVGEVAGVSIDPRAASADAELPPRTSALGAHAVTLHLGSSLHY